MRSIIRRSIIVSSVLISACTSNTIQQTSDSNRLLVRKYHEAWSTGNTNELPDILDTAFILHFMGNYDYTGIDGARQAIMDTRKSFPDWKETVTEVVAEPSRAVSIYRSTGTQQGSYDTLAASGNKVDIPETSIFRIEHGKIMEQWAFWDEILFQQQLRKRGLQGK